MYSKILRWDRSLSVATICERGRKECMTPCKFTHRDCSLYIGQILFQTYLCRRCMRLWPHESFITVLCFPMRPPLWENSLFYYGIFFMAIFSVLALDLNIEGFRCLSILNQEEIELTDSSFRGLEWNCFLVTNSYVYSLFGIGIGAILLFIWYRKEFNQSRWINAEPYSLPSLTLH